jgi:hypothetical protein
MRKFYFHPTVRYIKERLANIKKHKKMLEFLSYNLRADLYKIYDILIYDILIRIMHISHELFTNKIPGQ